MFQLGSKSKVVNFLLLICTLLIPSSGVSCGDSFNGGRKTLELAPSLESQNDADRMLSTLSSVCRIVLQEGDLKDCFGVLLSSRWLLTVSSCAPRDRRLSDDHFRVVCGTPSRSSAFTYNEFEVVEVKALRSASTGEKQETDVALLKLDTDAPGPFIKFEESKGPDFYTREQSELMKTFFNVSDLRIEQTRGSWQKSNIDLIGLPLILNSSAMRDEDRAETALHQITTCCLATACQLFRDGITRCNFSRVTPKEHKSICRTTGICNEVSSASSVTPSFQRSLPSSSNVDICPDPPTLFPNEERCPIPPFVPLPFCSNDTKTELQSMSNEQMMLHLKHLVDRDDATGVNNTLTCSEFNTSALDNDHETFLHEAAWHNSNRSAKVLCELGINTEVKNKLGKTALVLAANRTSFETLKVILNFSTNVSAADNKGRTAMHFAAIHNSNRIAEILCDEQIELEARDNKNKTALIVAAEYGNLDTLKVIVNSCKNVNVNATDNVHKTALHYAVMNNSVPMAQVLCNAGIDTEIRNEGGRTALLAAAYQNKTEALKGILECCKSVDINAKGREGKTALHYAVEKDFSNVADVLCNASINTEIRNKRGRTALLTAANQDKAEVLQVILNSCANVNVNATDKDHKTALHYATKECNFKMAKLLLENNASRFIMDTQNCTAKDLIPLHSGNCKQDTIDLLYSLFPIESNHTVCQAA